MRQYVRDRELKAAGMEWTDVLAAEDESRRARLAAELLASRVHGNTACVKAFIEQGGGCRATFFTTSVTTSRRQRLSFSGVGYVLPTWAITSYFARGAHRTPHNRSNHGPPRKPIRRPSGGETTNGLLCSPNQSVAIRIPIRVNRCDRRSQACRESGQAVPPSQGKGAADRSS